MALEPSSCNLMMHEDDSDVGRQYSGFRSRQCVSTAKIVRKELYKANIGTQPISTVDGREIVLQPKQMTASASLSRN
jgi:hypothetical protein